MSTMDLAFVAAVLLTAAGWLLGLAGRAKLPADLRERVKSLGRREDTFVVLGVLILMVLYAGTAVLFPQAGDPLFAAYLVLFFAIQFIGVLRFRNKLAQCEVNVKLVRLLSLARLLYTVALLVFVGLTLLWIFS